MTILTMSRYGSFAHRSFVVTQGVIDNSHIVLSGGAHSEVYLNADRVFTDSWRMVAFYRHWKSHFFDGVGATNPEVVVGPATGAIYLVGGFTQYLTNTGIAVNAAWADKNGQDFALERSRFAAVVRCRRVLVVEDIITTGASAVKTIAAVQAAGGNVVGVACMVNRTKKVTADSLNVPELCVAWQLDIPSFSPENCPLCAEGRPIVTNIGHGKEFSVANPEYIGGYTEVAFDEQNSIW